MHLHKKILFILLFCFGSAWVVYSQTPKLEESLALKYIVQLPVEKTAKPPVIILLHGYGSNEKDLFELRSFLPKQFVVVSTRAPYVVQGAGYQWFERDIINGKYTGRKEDLDYSRTAIAKFIPQVVKKYNADSTNVYLIGFSQGAMMCYEVGLTSPTLVKGIGVLSGRMPESLRPMVKKSARLSTLKVFVAHGTADSRLPFSDGKEAADYVRFMGAKPEFHKYEGMDHSITNAVMVDLIKWLQ